MKAVKRNGFTLAELLIVVAIVSILTAISIPMFQGKLEVARKTADAAEARNIKAVLAEMVMDGEIIFESNDPIFPFRGDKPNKFYDEKDPTKEMPGYRRGVFVRVTKKDQNHHYANNKHVFAGCDYGIIVQGEGIHNTAKNIASSWQTPNHNLEQALIKSGIDLDALEIQCKDKKNGWDFYIVEVFSDGSSIIYSGYQNINPMGAENYYPAHKPTNIEAFIY